MKTKTTQKLFSAAFVLLAFSLGGCSEDAEDAIQNVAEAPTLQGTFENKCSSSMLLDASEQTSYKFEGNQFTRSQVFYSEEDCKNESGRIEYTGDFKAKETGENSATTGGTLDIEVTEAKVLAKTDGIATALNAINFCGKNDYKKGEEVTLSGEQTRDLCPIDNVPANLYTNYRTDDINLYLADTDLSAMATNPDSRNKEIKYQEYYTKEGAVEAKEQEDQVKADAKAAGDKVEAEAKEAKADTRDAADKLEAETKETANKAETETKKAANKVETETKQAVDKAEAETKEAAQNVEQEAKEVEADVKAELDD